MSFDRIIERPEFILNAKWKKNILFWLESFEYIENCLCLNLNCWKLHKFQNQKIIICISQMKCCTKTIEFWWSFSMRFEMSHGCMVPNYIITCTNFNHVCIDNNIDNNSIIWCQWEEFTPHCLSYKYECEFNV